MRTPRVRRACAAAGAAAAVLLAACADDPRLTDVTTVAPPPVAPATADPAEEVDPADPVASAPGTSANEPSGPTTSATGTGTAPAGETVEVSTTAVDVTVAGPATGPMFSDALGEKVTGAPGVRTPGDTRRLLPEGLYVHLAWTADPSDPSVFTPTPDDIPILEAYANAVTAYYREAMTSRRPDSPGLLQHVVDPVQMFGSAFSEAIASGSVLDIGSGVVLRPYVIERSATEAVVYDCYLQDEMYVIQGIDREAGGLSPKGQAVTLSASGETWLVSSAGLSGNACL